MKLSTLFVPVAVAALIGCIGFGVLGGAALLWVVASWFLSVPLTFVYVALSSKEELTDARERLAPR
jgi:hypothetical protein